MATRHRHSISGFSLLEVLVAVAVFAVVAVLAWGGLDTLARSRAHLAEQSASLTALQRAVGRLERDLRQAAVRPVRDVDGSVLPALRGGEGGVELTRYAAGGGWQSAAPALERLAWRCRDGRLERWRWPVLDRAPNTRAEIETALERVHDCRWRYFDGFNRLDRWPPEAAQTQRLPRAVELRFTREGEGEYRRLLELPDAGPLP